METKDVFEVFSLVLVEVANLELKVLNDVVAAKLKEFNTVLISIFIS